MPQPIEKPVQIRVICRFCKSQHHITVGLKDYERWKDGELIQRAMPYLSADARELLISNICGSCF